MDYEHRDNIDLLFQKLNQNEIEYALLKNVDNELPNRLRVSKDIDIIVNETCRDKFHQVINEIGRKIIHPYSKMYGWNTLYDLPEFEFWRLFNGEELYVDITYRLCCRSLMPNLWIPLDDSIQEYLWKNRSFDEENKWWILDDNTMYVYLIVRSIFDKGIFSDRYVKTIDEKRKNIQLDIVNDMFEKIFFGFTPTLMQLLEQKSYSSIKDEFLSYSSY